MSASSILSFATEIEVVSAIVAIVLMTSIADYYSFGLSRALKDPLYRTRAIFTGLLATGLVSFVLVDSVTNIIVGSCAVAPTPTCATFVQLIPHYVAQNAFLLILIFWVDITIRAATDQDYFHRNTFRWSKARYVFLIGLFILAPLYVLNIPAEVPSGIIIASSGLALLGFGAFALLVSARRTKDKSTRNYLKWLSLAVAFLIVQVVSSFYFTLVPLAITAFFLYKMARSLSPIGKIDSKVEPQTREN